MRQTQYQSLYLSTAVCPATGDASGLICQAPNVEVINAFLRQFAQELPPGVHAVLIWDGAGYHTSPKLVIPANVSLIGLVPYSPELNPVENLWHYLRSHYWSLRVSASIEALEEAAESARRAVCLVPEMVRSKSTPLSRPQQLAFAEAALELRPSGTIEPKALIAPRRVEDRPAPDGARDLWRVLNSAQEGLIKGGVEGIGRAGRRMATKPIEAIDAGVKTNRALWLLAEKMAELVK